MGHYFNPNIPKENLHFIVDALNVMSYPGTGTIWTNLARPGFNDLTHTNSPTYSSAGSSTNIAYNGTNQYSVNSSLTDPVSIQGPFTINVIFSPSSLSGTQNIFSLYDNASSSLQIGYNGTTGQVWKFGGTSILTYSYAGIGTVWHITYTCDGSNNSKLYVNGQLNNSGVVATNTGTPVFYTVGTYGAGAGQYFNGKVYYVSIHRQVHNEQEVAATWHAIKRRFGYSGIGTNPAGDAVIGGLQGGQ